MRSAALAATFAAVLTLAPTPAYAAESVGTAVAVCDAVQRTDDGTTVTYDVVAAAGAGNAIWVEIRCYLRSPYAYHGGAYGAGTQLAAAHATVATPRGTLLLCTDLLVRYADRPDDSSVTCQPLHPLT